jgi:predicted ribosomally synthesized peptide with SipW-like signal peptide
MDERLFGVLLQGQGLGHTNAWFSAKSSFSNSVIQDPDDSDGSSATVFVDAQ